MDMLSMMTRPTETELAVSVQENLFALFRTMAANLSGGEIEEGPGLSRHHTFPTNPMYKGVWATHLAVEETDAAIDETIAWFRACHAPFFFWWTGPGTTPDDLGQRLHAKGLIDFPQTTGPKPAGVDLINRYVAQVHRVTRFDPEVGRAFLKVMNLLAPPTSLMTPAMMWRVWP